MNDKRYPDLKLSYIQPASRLGTLRYIYAHRHNQYKDERKRALVDL